ncbi:MAG: LamB/YcsF family protein [Candidatus Gastranaerophilales bacterium]|nr:LamB/YcsF family protein [Candidatus Gastranaerophilales bacterium]
MSRVDKIDFNADGAQSFGVYQNDAEQKTIAKVSSVNVSCGFHAGDPITIKETLLFCKEHNIAIGAHVGYQDLQGFGYRPMDLTEEETEATVLYQVGAVASFANSYSLSVEHVRLHGAMYMRAAQDLDFAVAVAKAVKKFDKWAVLYLPYGKIAQEVENIVEINVAKEMLIDKAYDADGNFTEPSKPFDTDILLNRIRTCMYSGKIKIGGGEFLDMKCDSIHFDSKNPKTSELLDKAREIVMPSPYNYNKACMAGWSETLV